MRDNDYLSNTIDIESSEQTMDQQKGTTDFIVVNFFGSNFWDLKM